MRRRLYGWELPALISVETHGHVAVVQMAHGKANALDTALCRELAAQLAGLERSGHRAAVLTGRSIFSAGVDLLRLRDGGPGYLQEFLPALSEAFLALFSCPVPVVAAVNGAGPTANTFRHRSWRYQGTSFVLGASHHLATGDRCPARRDRRVCPPAGAMDGAPVGA